MQKTFCRMFGFLAGMFVVPSVFSATITVEWDANTESGIAGYRVYSGTASRAYSSVVEVTAPNTTAVISNLPHGQTFFLAVTAFDDAGLESDFSDEIGVFLAETDEDRAVSLVISNGADGTMSVTRVPAHGVLSGSPPNLFYTPGDDYSGGDSCALVLTESNSNTTPVTVLISVSPVNDVPTLDGIADVGFALNTGPQQIPLSGISSGASNELQALTVTAVSSDPAIVPHPTVDYTSPNSSGVLTVTGNTTGSVSITVSVNDGAPLSNVTSRTFAVTVTPDSVEPPRISNFVVVPIDARTVIAGFDTAVPVRSAIEFGPTAALGAGLSQEFATTNHVFVLSNLQPATNYFVQASTTNGDGGVTRSDILTVQTWPVDIVMWSAESGQLVSPMAVGNTNTAMHGAFISSSQDEAGTASYDVQVATESEYHLWCRLWASAPGAGSLVLTLEDGSQQLFETTAMVSRPGWQWLLVGNSTNGTWRNRFTAGSHRVTLRNQASGVLLDEFMISNDPTWVPGMTATAPILTATNSGSDRIELSWSDGSDNEAGFRLEVSSDGVAFSELAVTPAGVTNFAHTGLGAAMTYHYRVYAFNEVDRTEYSPTVTVQTPAAGSAPSAPSHLLGLALGRKIILVWRDNSADETGFIVERSADGNAFATVQVTGAGVARAKDDPPAGRWFYRVRAFNNVGTSAPSSVVSITAR